MTRFDQACFTRINIGCNEGAPFDSVSLFSGSKGADDAANKNEMFMLATRNNFRSLTAEIRKGEG